MAYRFYADHPFFELFGSFVDSDEPQSFEGPRFQRGPCGPGFRGRHHGPGPHRHGHHGSHGHPGWYRPASDSESPRDTAPQQETPQEPRPFKPAVDVYSTETDYKVYISLPSAEKESIELTYDPNTRELAVGGTLVRPSEFASLDEDALKTVLVQGERKYGKFERKLVVPSEEGERIRFEEAAAKFENGVLELTLPKVEKDLPKTIVIE